MTIKSKPSLEALAKQHQSSYKQNITDIIKAGLSPLKKVYEEEYTHPSHDDIGLNFQDYDDPEIAAYICYTVLKELSKEDKSYFLSSPRTVKSIYKHIAATITPEKYKEEEDLKKLLERLNELYFSAIHLNRSMSKFELIDKDHIIMDLYDSRDALPRDRLNHITMKHGLFARFTLTERSEIKLTINLPTKEELEANPDMKRDFISLQDKFMYKEIQQALLDYGYIDKILTESEWIAQQKERRKRRSEEIEKMPEEEKNALRDAAILEQLEINDKLRGGGDTIPTSNIFSKLGPEESVIKVK